MVVMHQQPALQIQSTSFLPRALMNTRGQGPKAATHIAERVCAMRGHQQGHMSTLVRSEDHSGVPR